MVSLLFNQRTLNFALAYALCGTSKPQKQKAENTTNSSRFVQFYEQSKKKINKLLSSKMFQNEKAKKTTPKNIYCVSGPKNTFFVIQPKNNSQTSVEYSR